MTRRTLGLMMLPLLFGACSAKSQTVDLGRGELPLFVPAGYEETVATPLVVMLHGYGSTGLRYRQYIELDQLVDEYGFLLVYPEGTEEEAERPRRFWNASAACCNFRGSDVDDVQYLVDIINDIRARYHVDLDRIYLFGHSNGGFMAYRFAYEHPELAAAIVSLAGAASTEPLPPPAGRVHVLQIHGTADETILFEGGDIGDIAYPGALETARRWADYSGCELQGTPGLPLDLDTGTPGVETVVTRFASSCQSGGSSELWAIEGGSHGPTFTPAFEHHVIDWLLAHPKR